MDSKNLESDVADNEAQMLEIIKQKPKKSMTSINEEEEKIDR